MNRKEEIKVVCCGRRMDKMKRQSETVDGCTRTLKKENP